MSHFSMLEELLRQNQSSCQNSIFINYNDSWLFKAEFAFLLFFPDLLEANQLGCELYQTEPICMNNFLFQQYQNQ